MDILLMRHPEIEDSAKGKCIGQTDVALSQKGLESLSELSMWIINFNPQTLMTSDLTRCKKLAEAAALQLELDEEVSPVWREINFGHWENRTWDEIDKTDGMTMRAWMQDFVRQSPPNGESFAEVLRRVSAQLELIVQRPESRLAVVTHVGVIRAAICFATGLPPERAFAIEIEYGGTVWLRFKDGQWTLYGLRNNDL
jgi:alpha-ribazole phosphatase